MGSVLVQDHELSAQAEFSVNYLLHARPSWLVELPFREQGLLCGVPVPE